MIAGEPGTEDLTADYPYEFETCDQVSIFEPGDDPGTEDIERVLARQ